MEGHARTRLRVLNAPVMLVIALIMLITSIAFSSTLAHTAVWLFIISILGGSMNSLTDANDRRVVNGRLLYDGDQVALREERSLAERDYLAVGGLIAVVVTWILLPLAYAGLSGINGLRSFPKAQFMNDIVTAFTAPVVIGKLSIPSLPLGFFWAGGCSLLQTFLFLILLRRRGVVFYVLLTPVIYGFDVLLGIFIFTDPVSKQELGFFIPLVVILLLVIGVQKWFASSKYTDADQITSMAEPSRRDGLQIAAFVVLAIALNSATHMIQRGVIYGLRLSDPTRTTGVALAFRAAYFSVFAVYGFFWVGSKILSNSKRRAQNIRKDQESRADPPLTLKALRLASVTALTGGFALLLQASPISSNLAIGPLATNSARIIVAPLVVALYAVEGRALQLLPRIVGAYGGLGSRRLGKLGNRLLVGLGIILFALLSLVIILWTITKLGFRLDLPTIPFG